MKFVIPTFALATFASAAMVSQLDDAATLNLSATSKILNTVENWAIEQLGIEDDSKFALLEQKLVNTIQNHCESSDTPCPILCTEISPRMTNSPARQERPSRRNFSVQQSKLRHIQNLAEKAKAEANINESKIESLDRRVERFEERLERIEHIQQAMLQTLSEQEKEGLADVDSTVFGDIANNGEAFEEENYEYNYDGVEGNYQYAENIEISEN